MGRGKGAAAAARRDARGARQEGRGPGPGGSPLGCRWAVDRAHWCDRNRRPIGSRKPARPRFAAKDW
ncbi:hypothetical protein Snoj_20200 [Streptomyces nojiriensis]|uniref:Uncharacterized protein n=1 Tax=Streptomyces nojiriensis TaxID=66374 RepID=A0ABQ3SJH3_9ACTN|nr:hypothetical protein GCM10010205_56980 [Streptomyces nojiriensis]GHI68102.1 hypothetical protein Snoj_20200 [Streptomyces nojiriensis]